MRTERKDRALRCRPYTNWVLELRTDRLGQNYEVRRWKDGGELGKTPGLPQFGEHIPPPDFFLPIDAVHRLCMALISGLVGEILTTEIASALGLRLEGISLQECPRKEEGER